MQAQPGRMQCRVPHLGHYDLLFTFRSTSKENLVWVIYWIQFYAWSPNLVWYLS